MIAITKREKITILSRTDWCPAEREGFTSIIESHEHLDFRASGVSSTEQSLFGPYYMEITPHQQTHRIRISKSLREIR